MISDQEAHAHGLWFNYRPTQWRAIADQVARIAAPTEPFASMQLLEAANTYLDECFRSPRERAQEFEEIGRIAEHLRLSVASSFAVDHESVAQVPPEWLDRLEELERWAKHNEALFRLGWSAKWRFYRTVLECWGNAGGSFRRSRSKPAERDGAGGGGQASGPTVLYVEAAVEPVMGDQAPGREAICKLIIRHRRDEEEMQREMERVLREARSARRPNAVQKELLALDKESRSARAR